MFHPFEQRRIDLTVSCHDVDAIAKVPAAGEVLTRDVERVQVMHNGVVVLEGGYYGAWMTEVIRRLRGHHEPQEEAAFHVIVERLRADTPAPVMVELGSFWAYYSLWLQRACPQASLILVEPDPAYMDVGRRNVELNGARATFVAAAIGLPSGSLTQMTCESDGLTRPTAVISVDGLIEQEGLPRIDVLLCDTQGAELDMLVGASAALAARRIRFLVISTHHHSVSGDPLIHRRCLELLAEHGAHVIAEHTVSESFSGDGLIVASLDPRDTDLRLSPSRARACDSLFGEPERELAALLSERDAGVAVRSPSSHGAEPASRGGVSPPRPARGIAHRALWPVRRLLDPRFADVGRRIESSDRELRGAIDELERRLASLVGGYRDVTRGSVTHLGEELAAVQVRIAELRADIARSGDTAPDG